MTSQINNLYINIDEAYPVAGVDNDSQGFRDNFDIVKSCLALASIELTELQDTAGRITTDNNFAGNSIINTVLVTNTEQSNATGVFSQGVPQLQFRNGGHQRVLLDADDLNVVVSWNPTATNELVVDRYARMIVEVSTLSAGDSFNVIWAVEGGGFLKYSKNYPVNFKVTLTPKLIEFSTYDGGDTMFVKYLGEFDESENVLAIENYDELSEDLASGTISLERKTSRFTPTVLATGTLTAGVEGQIKTLIMKSATGEITVNVAQPGWKVSGGGVVQFDSIGQACTLQYTDGKWYCVGNNGAVFA